MFFVDSREDADKLFLSLWNRSALRYNCMFHFGIQRDQESVLCGLNFGWWHFIGDKAVLGCVMCIPRGDFMMFVHLLRL